MDTLTTAFDRAIAVQPAGDGRATGSIDEGWSAPLGPNGGYLAAIAVRALEAQVDPAGERRVRALTCHYLRRAVAGPIELEVETVRAGRRLATGRLTGRQDGREVIAAIAAFSSPGLDEVAAWAPALPDVPGPPDRDATVVRARDWRGKGWLGPDDGTPQLLEHVRLAPRIGGRPFSGRAPEPGVAPTTGGWIELADRRPIDAAFVALCTDVWWPPSLEPLSRAAGAPTIDLTIHFRADLPPGGLDPEPVLGRFESSAAIGGLVEEDGVLFLADGTLLAQSRQLALLTPVG
ncbi:MAG: hypothetical protein QOJ07_317 [Thermoleophilaceae bacterium]|jgi:acyl-CoA thioesterase|nr:hypothetical protein [Thermoleophilaceae bacterium]